MINQKGKLIIIFSTQRSGSTMVTSDFTQSKVLGNPSEYFTEKILPGSKFSNCSLSTEEIQEEIRNILQKARTANGIVSIKVMSDYIIEIAKAIEKIGVSTKDATLANNLVGQQRKAYLQKLFIDFFNNLDIDGKFIAFRVYRKNKVKQAISRFVAAETGLYHVWRDDKGKLVNHYDRPAEKATPFSLDIENSYDYKQISSLMDSIYQEERELDIFFENFNISPINLIYENIVQDTSYLEPIVRKIQDLEDTNAIGDIQRKTVKTASAINSELIQRFNNDGGYNSKLDFIISVKHNLLKHIPSLPDTTMVNESCFWNKEIIDIQIDAPYLKPKDDNFLVIGGVIISHKEINKIFVFNPTIGKNYQAEINLRSEYFGSVYWGVSNSEKARFRCLIPLKGQSLNNKQSSNLELNYKIGQLSPVKLVQIDISRFIG